MLPGELIPCMVDIFDYAVDIFDYADHEMMVMFWNKMFVKCQMSYIFSDIVKFIHWYNPDIYRFAHGNYKHALL